MLLTFIVIFIIFTIVNYIIGAFLTNEFSIKNWELDCEWVAFILTEVICIIGAVLISCVIYTCF